MPLPKRKKCMSSEIMKKEFPKVEQRFAVCKKQSKRGER